MKIAIDGRVTPKNGIGRYTEKLIEKFAQFYPDDEVVVLHDQLSISRQSVSQKYGGTLKRLYWEQFILPGLLKESSFDIFHNPRNLGMPWRHSCPAVVTLHDIIPYVYQREYLPSPIEKAYYYAMLKTSIASADRIITISQFSRDEIIRYLGVAPDKVKVVYHGSCEEFYKMPPNVAAIQIKEHFSLGGPYILTIGGSEPRKNIRRLISAFKKLLAQHRQYQDLQLVVVGGNWRNLDLASEFQADSSIRFVEGVSQDDLVALYNGAKLFIYPSLYEGFGFPVLEAMACGTPTAAARASSIPEIAGDAALYFEPLDENDMYQKLNLFLQDKDLRGDYISRGFKQIQKFTWEETIHATRQIYADVLP